MGITDIWTVFILRPMLNALLGLYTVLGSQFWLAIIVFTVVVRVLMTPLMLPQQRSAKKMQELQPRLQELQKNEVVMVQTDHGLEPAIALCIVPLWPEQEASRDTPS